MKRPLFLIIVTFIIITGCGAMEFVGFSQEMDAVKDVDLQRYLGKWYEYARLENSFEKGMTETTAEYSPIEPDRKGRPRIQVVNSGYRPNGKFSKVKGKAVLPSAEEPGRLKVSFFGPFYADYNIIALDLENYQWALVAGSSTQYLWFLSREPQMEPEIYDKLKAIAEGYGFDTDALIFPQVGVK